MYIIFNKLGSNSRLKIRLDDAYYVVFNLNNNNKVACIKSIGHSYSVVSHPFYMMCTFPLLYTAVQVATLVSLNPCVWYSSSWRLSSYKKMAQWRKSNLVFARPYFDERFVKIPNFSFVISQCSLSSYERSKRPIFSWQRDVVIFFFAPKGHAITSNSRRIKNLKIEWAKEEFIWFRLQPLYYKIAVDRWSFIAHMRLFYPVIVIGIYNICVSLVE